MHKEVDNAKYGHVEISKGIGRKSLNEKKRGIY